LWAIVIAAEDKWGGGRFFGKGNMKLRGARNYLDAIAADNAGYRTILDMKVKTVATVDPALKDCPVILGNPSANHFTIPRKYAHASVRRTALSASQALRSPQARFYWLNFCSLYI